MSSTSTESAANLRHKHFNALGDIHIFAGIANCVVRGYMVSPSRSFLLWHVLLSRWQLRSRHILYMVKGWAVYRYIVVSQYCIDTALRTTLQGI